jgi:hypothetical protein
LELLKNIKQELIQKLESIVSMFMNILDGGKRKVLKLLIELLEYISLKDKSMSREQFKQRLSSLVLLAIEQDYDTLRIEQIQSLSEVGVSAPSLIKITQILKDKIGDIFFYSYAIPSEYIEFESRALKIYYQRFTTDYEQVLNSSSNGFTGYQMLVFCHNLKELNNEINELFEDDEELIQLLNPEQLIHNNRGIDYEQNYILELKNRLITYMQRSVALDKWDRLNEQVLHSTSLVDFFTCAFQTLEFLSKLEFINSNLLNRFEQEVLSEVVIEYAKILKELSIRDVMIENQNENSVTVTIPSSCVLNTKGLCLLFKMKDETVNVVNITTQFIIKLNNIEASRDQYKQLIEATMDEKIYFKEDDPLDTDSEDNNDTESEEDESTAKYSDTLFALSEIEQELIVLIASQFEPFIRSSLSQIMNNIKKIVNNNTSSALTEEQLIKQYGNTVTKMLETSLLELAITPNLSTLSENIYNTAFLRILSQIFAIVVRECVNLLLPSATFGVDSQDVLENYQIVLLKHLIRYCEEYCYGSGEGISRQVIAREKRFIDKVFQLYELETLKLIELYNKYTSTNNTNRSGLKGFHILAVINTRVKYDKEANNFFSKNREKALELFLVNEFALPLQSLSTTTEKYLIQCSHCGNERLVKGYYFLTRDYFLWKPISIFKGVDPSFLQQDSAIDVRTGKFKIYLKDVTSVRPLDPWITKGMKIYYNDYRVKIHLGNRPLRDKLMKLIVTQCKNIGNSSVQILEARKRSISQSITRTHKIFRNLSTTTTSQSHEVASSSPKMNTMTWTEVDQLLQKRFDISNTKLLESYNCSCCLMSQQSEMKGTLYLFDSCFCFDNLNAMMMMTMMDSNSEEDDNIIVVSWVRVMGVRPSLDQTELTILLNDGRELKIFNCLSSVQIILNSIDGAMTSYRNDNQKILQLRNSDIVAYYLAHFNIDNDELLKVVNNCIVPGSSSSKEFGTLYIGENYLCFERDNGKETIVINNRNVQSVTRKNWKLMGRICISVLLKNGIEHRFIIRDGVEQVFDLIQRRHK